MTFVEGFYSFNLEISNPDSGIYAKTRVKTPKHPNETFEHLHARVLAYCHCYQAELKFTRGLFETSEPTIWKKDVIENLLVWVQVGCPSRKKLQKALRANGGTDYRVYFFEEVQLEGFCGYLRGSKSNWIQPVKFFQLDTKFLEATTDLARSSSTWNITIVDDNLYLTINGQDFQTAIVSVDMWHQFQLFLSEQTERTGGKKDVSLEL
ncbi:YaeQ family protein [Oligoflexia bacterium]|nr:YaeQ family protein [Oligoflexia bacterium]